MSESININVKSHLNNQHNDKNTELEHDSSTSSLNPEQQQLLQNALQKASAEHDTAVKKPSVDHHQMNGDMLTHNMNDGMKVKIDSLSGMPNQYNYLNTWANNPMILLIITIIIVFYYALFNGLGVNNTQASISGNSFFEVIIWSFFIILVMINGFQYFFGINIIASASDLFTEQPKIDLKVELPSQESEIPEITEDKQVFHISNNLYNFDDAKAICKAYGADLADYNQIKEAYEAGGEWCGFGWSKDQMAFYPTQEKTYEKLQKIKGHEHDCGRPGINGGYIANPNVKFGVNCFGYKPKINQEEATLMETTPFYPKSKEDIEFEQKVKYWKGKIPEILISPFNKNNWSQV